MKLQIFKGWFKWTFNLCRNFPFTWHAQSVFRRNFFRTKLEIEVLRNWKVQSWGSRATKFHFKIPTHNFSWIIIKQTHVYLHKWSFKVAGFMASSLYLHRSCLLKTSVCSHNASVPNFNRAEREVKDLWAAWDDTCIRLKQICVTTNSLISSTFTTFNLAGFQLSSSTSDPQKV